MLDGREMESEILFSMDLGRRSDDVFLYSARLVGRKAREVEETKGKLKTGRRELEMNVERERGKRRGRERGRKMTFDPWVDNARMGTRGCLLGRSGDALLLDEAFNLDQSERGHTVSL